MCSSPHMHCCQNHKYHIYCLSWLVISFLYLCFCWLVISFSSLYLCKLGMVPHKTDHLYLRVIVQGHRLSFFFSDLTLWCCTILIILREVLTLGSLAIFPPPNNTVHVFTLHRLHTTIPFFQHKPHPHVPSPFTTSAAASLPSL